jgi:hypothetical protein
VCVCVLITTFTRDLHLSLPEPDQSNPYQLHYLSKINLNIIHSPTLGLPSPSDLLPSNFPTNNLHAFPFCHINATCLAHLIPNLIIPIILDKEYKLQSSPLCSLLHPHHFIPLQSKYSPQSHLKLKSSNQFYSHLLFTDL